MDLPEKTITLPGKILNISDTSTGINRVSIGFTRNAQEIAVIMRYIKDRRGEILKEIDRMYQQAYHQKDTSGASQQ
jgi:hypothetical protein